MAKRIGYPRNLPFRDAAVLLKKEGFPFVETAFAETEKDVISAASRLGFPVFLKVVSSLVGEGAIHKARQGLVVECEGEKACSGAFRKLAAAHSRLAVKHVIDRKLVVAVQKAISGKECIIGARRDPSFGPIVVFGSGGVMAEVIDDVSVRLCPVKEDAALAAVSETAFGRQILGGKNGHEIGRSLSALVAKLSGLMLRRPDISGLDVNPLIVDDSGKITAVDARIVVAAEKKAGKAVAAFPAVKSFFTPASVAVVGASREQESVGQAIMRNLTIGCVHRCEYCRPFLGRIFPVNPFASEILGLKCYPSILAVPESVDLAIIAIPHQLVLKAAEECARKKVKAVIIISAGFGEFSSEGGKLQEKIAQLFAKAKIPMLGPNCLGIIRPSLNLNASFAPSMPPKGQVAFVSQSGALADSIIDWAIQSRYGLSALVSYGNKAMLDCNDFFDFLSGDDETKSVALYIEGVGDGRRFFEQLVSLAAKKPVVILKGGRTSSGVAAAATHTASLAGNVKVFEAAVRQAGAFVAETVEELFDLAKILAEQPVCGGNGVAVVTNGGGCGVICSDYCDELGVNLPQLQKSLIRALDKSGVMHPAYSRRNPLDIVGDALADRYALAVNSLLDEPYIHGLIVIQTLQAMTNPVANAKVIVEAHKLHPDKPIISCFMGGRFSRKGMHYLDNMRIPDFNDIRKAVVAMHALIKRGEFLGQMTKQPAAVAVKARRK